MFFSEDDPLKGALVKAMREVRPTLVIGVPRVFEKMEEQLKELGKSAPFYRRWAMGWAKAAAERHHGKMGRKEEGMEMRLARKLLLR